MLEQKIAMATYLLIVAFLEVNLTLTFNIDQHCLLIYRHLNTYLQCTIFCIDSGMQNSQRSQSVWHISQYKIFLLLWIQIFQVSWIIHGIKWGVYGLHKETRHRTGRASSDRIHLTQRRLIQLSTNLREFNSAWSKMPLLWLVFSLSTRKRP